MKIFKLFILVILTLSLVACSKPAPEPPALPNQPPPPKATAVPTPTPVYYNLDLVVKDPAGQAIPGASAVAGDQSSQAGATGIVSFVDLSAGPLPLTVYAEGYRPKQLTQTLQPGDNQIEVVLEPDPFGLLPDNACAPTESLLYLEDFQDGQAQGWDAIESQAPGWSIEQEAGQPGNQVASARGPDSVDSAWFEGGAENRPENASFDNVIWRVRVKTQEKATTRLNFRFVEKPGDNRRYSILAGDGGAQLARYENDQQVDLGPLGELTPGEWHLFEIGYFDGALTVFVDREQRMVYQETQPWEGGTINLEPHSEQDPTGQAAVFYDDLSVCGLFEPPQPLPPSP